MYYIISSTQKPFSITFNGDGINDEFNLKSKNNAIKNYIETLSPLEYKALAISIRELETSFSLEKSIGYINYTKSLK